MIGTTLGHYQVLSKLGQGGMGVVYRAADLKLGREVAIKVLPQGLQYDAGRLARFNREARLLAVLNHPNIAAIYGFEQERDVRYLVLELAPGQTLAEVIAGGPLPLDTALAICRQIAEAVEAAHAKGIVHRDLKPANVKVTADGKVKVLDFGLAKVLHVQADLAEGVQVQTLTDRVILGTPAYMSPEQARGRTLDKQTDIWSLGCLLFEELTGRRAFGRDTVSDTLAAILTGVPDWSALPADTPANIRVLLRRCLEKDPARRLHDIADARIELEDSVTLLLADSERERTTEPRRHRHVLWMVMALAVVLLAAGAALWIWRRGPSPAQPEQVRRLVVELPPGQPLAFGRWAPLGISRPGVAISPDGKLLVWVGVHQDATQLYARSLDQFEATPIPGTQGAFGPFFSPDSRWVGFFAENELKKVSLLRGEPVSVCHASNPYGASWAPDDAMFFAEGDAAKLFRVSASGGAPQAISTERLVGTVNPVDRCRWPEVLPGGKAVLFSTGQEVAVLSLDKGDVRVLVERGTYARYAPTGHLVFVRSGLLLAAPFDLGRLEVTGPPVPVLQGVRTEYYGVGQFGFSLNGSLVYIPGAPQVAVELVWVDRHGKVNAIGAPTQVYGSSRVSPDGRRLAVVVAGTNSDIWVYDLIRGTRMRITFEGNGEYPVWSPDGKRIVFSSAKAGQWGVFWQAADGSGAAEQLLSTQSKLVPTSCSPDGRVLAFTQPDASTGQDIWILPLRGDRKPLPFVRSRFEEWGAVFSPDGRSIAYTSNESGQYEVYVRRYPEPGGSWQISSDGGEEPVWSPDGRELFYRNGQKWIVVTVPSTPEVSARKLRLLFEGPYVNVPGPSYDISPDGHQFLMLRPASEERPGAQLNVVLGWFEELKQRVPAAKR